MKRIILLTLIFSAFTAFGQRVHSFCTAPDSVVAKYREDADRLTVQRLHRLNHPDKDRVELLPIHSQPLLDAMLAIYNARQLEVRDSVVDILKIHHYPFYFLTEINVGDDPEKPWMQNLSQGIFPCGNELMDSVLLAHNFELKEYKEYSTNGFAFFSTDRNTNVLALTRFLKSEAQVRHSDPDGWVGDGPQIADSIFTDHVELIYSYGWGDCPSGCIYRRYWKFKVYDDCSVEYAGNANNFTGIDPARKHAYTLSPQPFKDSFKVSGLTEQAEYRIYSTNGQLVEQGRVGADGQVNVTAAITQGMYIFQLATGQGIWHQPLLKTVE